MISKISSPLSSCLSSLEFQIKQYLLNSTCRKIFIRVFSIVFDELVNLVFGSSVSDGMMGDWPFMIFFHALALMKVGF